MHVVGRGVERDVAEVPENPGQQQGMPGECQHDRTGDDVLPPVEDEEQAFAPAPEEPVVVVEQVVGVVECTGRERDRDR